MTRRLFLCGTVVTHLGHPQELATADFLEALEPLTSALSTDVLPEQSAASQLVRNATRAFSQGLSRDFPERDKLLEAVSSLLAVVQITSSVIVVEASGKRATLDWLMDMHFRSATRVSLRRRETVTVEVERGRVARLEPLRFFRLPEN